MSGHNLPPELVKTLDSIPEYKISIYLSQRIHKDHPHKIWGVERRERLIQSLNASARKLRSSRGPRGSQE